MARLTGLDVDGVVTVTGGYPVAAVVLDADVDRAAQVRPGQQVRFRLVDPPWAP